jgi:hypothetical protein
VYIVDSPADETGESKGEDAKETDAGEKDAAPENDAKGGSSLDLADLFEAEEEVDEAFQDLVASAGDVVASDLATQLQEIMASLNNRAQASG